MGGWMTYQRARTRNALPRVEDPHANPYPEPDPARPWRHLIAGDLNRMERDYLDPRYPQPPFATRPASSDPAAECATATGIDIDTVRAVLRFVFLGQP